MTFKLAESSECSEKKSIDEKEQRQKVSAQSKIENESKAATNLQRELDKIDITQMYEANSDSDSSHSLFNIDFNLEINNRLEK